MTISQSGNEFVLDYKRGDVTGDGAADLVYLTGRKPDGEAGAFAEDITLVAEDGGDGSIRAVKPPYNAGYDARLFLGDFTGDGIGDIKIGYDAGGSGGYGIHYVYSFRDYVFRLLFDFEAYNAAHQFKVEYKDYYRVSVVSPELNRGFILDIGDRGYDYLSQYYKPDGTLKGPVQGAVLALGALLPAVYDEKANMYGLLAFQRIIGPINADTLGYVENLLYWDGRAFASRYMVASVSGPP